MDLLELYCNEIERIVRYRGMTKVMEVIPCLSRQLLSCSDEFDIHDAIDHLVATKKIVQIDYVLPNHNRVKTILFPYGTEIEVSVFK